MRSMYPDILLVALACEQRELCGIRMTMDDFLIDEIRQDVTESLKSAVRYLIPLDLRCFR